jgi:hypothetical protein
MGGNHCSFYVYSFSPSSLVRAELVRRLCNCMCCSFDMLIANNDMAESSSGAFKA